MKWLKRRILRLFYVPKYEKVSEQTISRVVPSSALGILFCAVCLAGLTWAWFSDSVTSNSGNITSAHFSAQVTVVSNQTVITPSSEDGSYTLAAGSYTVTVTASGNASTGYCGVILDGVTYHTVQLYPGSSDAGNPQSISFTLTVSEASASTVTPNLTVTPHWGTYANSNHETLIRNGDTVPFPSSTTNSVNSSVPESESSNNQTESVQSYTIKNGDTLTSIAKQYNTTVAALAAYNGIADPDVIHEGETIQIPPADYQVPDTSASSASDPET